MGNYFHDGKIKLKKEKSMVENILICPPFDPPNLKPSLPLVQFLGTK